MAGLCAPLPTLRPCPDGQRRTAWGRCGSLLLHRSGLPQRPPCRPPAAHPVTAAVSNRIAAPAFTGCPASAGHDTAETVAYGFTSRNGPPPGGRAAAPP